MRTDKSEAPEYLSAMRQIAARRKSDDLDMFIGQELSAGRHDSEQIKAAYQYFTIVNPTMSQPTDGDIIGTFEARLGSDPIHETEMRDMLKVIGHHRESSYILGFVERLSFASLCFFRKHKLINKHSTQLLPPSLGISWGFYRDNQRSYHQSIQKTG